jgi:hypothetical protein
MNQVCKRTISWDIGIFDVLETNIKRMRLNEMAQQDSSTNYLCCLQQSSKMRRNENPKKISKGYINHFP